MTSANLTPKSRVGSPAVMSIPALFDELPNTALPSPVFDIVSSLSLCSLLAPFFLSFFSFFLFFSFLLLEKRKENKLNTTTTRRRRRTQEKRKREKKKKMRSKNVLLLLLLSLSLSLLSLFISNVNGAQDTNVGMPSLPIDFTATYELVGEDIPKGTKAVVYNLLSKKKMRVDTSDPSGVVVTYYMFFNQPEGVTTSYTTYLSSCKKDTLQYHEGEELYLLPGHGPGLQHHNYSVSRKDV